MYEELGDQWGVATALGSLGWVIHSQGEYNKAIQLFEESLAIRKDIGDRRGIAKSWFGFGTIALSEGNVSEARLHFKRSLKLFHELSDKAGIAFALANLAITFYKTNSLELSTKLLSVCQVQSESLNLSFHPRIEEKMQESLNSIQSKLDKELFRSLWEKGRLLSMDEAIELALNSN